MGFKVAYKASAAKDLRKVYLQAVPRLLSRIETPLAGDPEAFPCLKGSFARIRKLRVGPYRVLFTIQGNTVLVLRVAHQKGAYR